MQDYLDALKAGLELAYDKYGAGTNYFGGTGLQYRLNDLPAPYQIYVVPIRATIRYYGTPIYIPLSASAITLPSYMFMSNGFGDGLAELAAHEFFHAVQWEYQQACIQTYVVPLPSQPPLPQRFANIQMSRAWVDFEDVRWWMESTADWAEQEPFRNIVNPLPLPQQRFDGYIPPIRTYLLRPWQHMDSRPSQGDDGFSYSPLFPFYLIDRMGAPNNGKDIIKSTWERYRNDGTCGSMKTAINNVLPTGSKLSNIFPDYTEANYFLMYANANEFRNIPPPPGLPARGLGDNFRPRADAPSILSEQLLNVIGPSNQYGGNTVDNLGAAYVEFAKNFQNRNLGRRLSIRVRITVSNLPNRPDPSVKIWTVTQAAPPVSAAPLVPPVHLESCTTTIGGICTYTVAAIIPNFDSDQVQWVGMMVTDPETRPSSMSWHYEADALSPP